jgi:flavin reductase (DIM6/NTAB) family NADH-FMN oxidoreductase RutF
VPTKHPSPSSRNDDQAGEMPKALEGEKEGERVDSMIEGVLPPRKQVKTPIDLRNVMRYFPSAVTVVTSALDTGELFGLTVSAFISVSLEPPLVLISIRNESTAKDLLIKSGKYCVNILSAAQQDIAVKFSLTGEAGRFLGLDYYIGKNGNPIIRNCIGYLDCRITQVIPAGDHTLFLAEVVDLFGQKKEPLLYVDREYVRLENRID